MSKFFKAGGTLVLAQDTIKKLICFITDDTFPPRRACLLPEQEIIM